MKTIEQQNKVNINAGRGHICQAIGCEVARFYTVRTLHNDYPITLLQHNAYFGHNLKEQIS